MSKTTTLKLLNVALFGKKALKLGSSWIWGALNPITGILIKERQREI